MADPRTPSALSSLSPAFKEAIDMIALVPGWSCVDQVLATEVE